MSAKKIEILKVKDPTDSYAKSNGMLIDLVFKIGIFGKSNLSGKTTLIFNLLANPKLNYKRFFLPENIFYITNNKLDKKMQILTEYLEIPESNIMNYNEQALEILYDYLEDEYLDEKTKKQKLIIFDDVAPSGELSGKQTGIISKFVMVGRHILVNQIYTAQKTSLLGTNIRSNLTCSIVFNTTLQELELLERSNNFLNSKRGFIKMFRTHVKTNRDFLIINYSNPLESMYMDKHFTPIDITPYMNL